MNDPTDPTGTTRFEDCPTESAESSPCPPGLQSEPDTPEKSKIPDEVLAFPRNDTWNHRRGEPRVFALVWTCYLLLTTVYGFARLGQAPLDLNEYRPSARAMLIGVAIGIGVLWPMVRLSQLRPAEGGLIAVRSDLPIVLIPMQAMLWPQIWLGRWSVQQIGIVGAALGIWTLCIGGAVAMALGGRQRPEEHSGRTHTGSRRLPPHWGWTLIVLGISGIAPASRLLGCSLSLPMFSPYTAVLHPLRDEWTIGGPTVTTADWAQIGILAVLSILVWVLASLWLQRSTPAHVQRKEPVSPRVAGTGRAD